MADQINQAEQQQDLNQLLQVRRDKLKVMQEGGFTDDELQSTRLALRGAMKSTTDSLGGIESWYLVQIIMNSEVSPHQNAEAMSNITREQVVEAAKRVHLDTVFFLKAKGGDAQ